MPLIPEANVAISATAAALAGGTGYHVVIAPVSVSADITPRLFQNGTDILAQHAYAPGVDYAALFIEGTKKPVIFIGVPIVTPGVVGRQNASGVLGTCVISAAAGGAGALDETSVIFAVTNPGTIGTTGIRGTLSLDGGITAKVISLGTANTYVIPYVGLTLSFGAGTLLLGDRYTFSTTAPMWDNAGLTAARLALVAQQKLSRTWMVIGDLPDATTAGFITTQVNAYETANKRFVLARAQVRDQLPLASKSRIPKTMTGAPSITFGATTTITRAAGSFLTDGFLVGDVVVVAGSVSNNGSRGAITALTATVMTFASGIVNEGPIGTVTIVGSEGLVFTTTTATRSVGSWLTDGFRVGDSVTTAGTASNNGTKVVTALTATVLTYASGGAAETIGSALVTMTKGETVATYVALMDAAFTSVDAQKRLSLGLGRLRKLSPITGAAPRRPVQWAASIREYQNDVHRPTWTKEDGPLDGWSALDASGNLAEYDEYVNGGGLAARFTVARSWGNGPNGAFIAMDLTREVEGSTLQFTHNMQVANVFCSIVQQKTENIIGKTPVLNADGTATSQALQLLEESVNTDVKQALMKQFVPGQGQRASLAVWRASTDDDLRGVNATLTGVGELRVNGTIVRVNTLVAVS
jgi:predicted regulator of Ras-like GTPase activity (Roadblock/LC7/MglB family)